MKGVRETNAYLKDLKRAMKRGKDFRKLLAIVELLAADEPLPPRCRPHRLSGRWQHVWECHIEPDWLLIYDVGEDAITLIRTGSHADLFD